MPKLDKRLLLEVAETLINGETCLFLSPNFGVNDRISDHFRKAFLEKVMAVRGCSELTARKLLRPEGRNPSFIQPERGPGWIFFHPNEDIQATEEIGSPAFVYWPTEGLDYQKIPYSLWIRERAKSTWRPVHLKGHLLWEDDPSPSKVKVSRDAWTHLLEDDF